MGPIGVLWAVGVLRSLAYVTFLNAMPLWLVAQGVASDSAIIGWTLGVYNAAAALGVVISGALDDKVSRRWLVVGSILLALPLLAVTLYVPTGFSAFLRHRSAGRTDGKRGHPAPHCERPRPRAARRRYRLGDADGPDLGHGGGAVLGDGRVAERTRAYACDSYRLRLFWCLRRCWRMSFWQSIIQKRNGIV